MQWYRKVNPVRVVDPNTSWDSTFSQGENHWFTAYPAFGWMIDKWRIRYIWNQLPNSAYYYPADAENGNSAMMITRDVERDAINWAENYIFCYFKRIHEDKRILTLSVVGPGQVTPSAGQYECPTDGQVSVTANPNRGARFVRWLLDGLLVGTNASYVVDMASADKSLQAVFEFNQTALYTNDLPCIADASIRMEDLSKNDGFTQLGASRAGRTQNQYWPDTSSVKWITWNSVMKFDTSVLPGGVIVSNLALHLWCKGIPDHNGMGYEVQETLDDWTEGGIVGANPRCTSIDYASSGFEYAQVNSYHIIPLSDRIPESKNWVDDWQTANYGLRVRPVQSRIDNDENFLGYYKFVTRHDDATNQWPFLRVTYLGKKLIPTIATDKTNIVVQVAKGLVLTNQTISIHNSGEGALQFAVSNNTSWLNLSGEITGTSTNENHQVTLNFNTATMAVGNYQGNFIVTDTNANNSPFVVPVLLTVLGPTISVSMTNISVEVHQGSNAAPTTLEVWNSGYSILDFSLLKTASWFSATPASGTSTGEVQEVSIQFSANNLAPGIYQDSLIITNTTAETPTVVIPVTLTVLEEVARPVFDPPGNAVYLTNVSLSITCATPGAAIHYTLDGSLPTEASQVYAGPFLLTKTTILRAKAWNLGMLPSAEQIATFEMLPPTITGQPQNQFVPPGSMAAFTVTAYGTQPFRYQWLKDGTNIVNGGGVTGATTETLTITNVQTNNAGNYSVVVTNILGAATSSPPAVLIVDGQKPTNQIVSPTNGQHWSNGVFTVTGTARDNFQVTNVWCHIIGGDWTNATTANLWTNWSVPLKLMGGTNIVQAYAVDAAGNSSTTNSVTFVYVVTNQLAVITNGQGTISPYPNNAWLEIGRRYTNTATAINGHKFLNWVIATNWVDGVTNTNASLAFLMQSNLTLTVNFADTNKPTLAITSPTAAQLWSNAVFTAKGTAGDNVRVSNVWYQLNGAGWILADTTNAYTNWSANLTLQLSNNVLRAYSADLTGNISPTNSVNFTYIVSDTLRVQAIGRGVLSPNYSNAVLQIGKGYSMTATPTNGHAFVNWMISTNWSGGVTSNSAALNFVMQSNLTLQANFVDTNKPTLAITSPTNSQRWSNEVFTIKGTAGDNMQVTNVWYQLNGAGWNEAVTTNSWTNWWEDVSLLPGTNAVQAFAVDATGNKSTTNSATFVYVVTNQLRIAANGAGTLSPNYSNAWLEIGRRYTNTATAINGHKFVNWTIATNWLGGMTSTNAALPFLMQSNLTLTINFADTNKPTLTLTNPVANSRFAVPAKKVQGTAGDNVRVAGVFYQLNTNVWALAGTTNGFTNWASTIALPVGTNTVKAYAVDPTGNYSPTSSVSFYCSNAFVMSLSATQTVVSGGPGLTLMVSTGMTCRIDVSTNLLNWAVLTNFTSTNTTMKFRDPAATNNQQRFYRGVVP